MSRRFGGLILALGLFLAPAAALADLAGGPPGGSAGAAGANGGDGGSGGGSGGKQEGGGCVTATPGAATRSAALVVGLGLLFAIPAARARRPKKPR